MAKKILVVEDTFIAVARQALVNNGDYEFLFSENLEDAMQAIQNGVDMVITDLFFPSVTNVVESLYQSLLQDPAYVTVLKDLIEGKLGEVDKYAFVEGPTRFEYLTEQPSGLVVVMECMNKKIPFIIVTAGNRHRGDLAIVRYTLPFMKTFCLDSDDNTGNKVSSDPLPGMVLGQGVDDPQKGEPGTWSKALAEVVKRQRPTFAEMVNQAVEKAAMQPGIYTDVFINEQVNVAIVGIQYELDGWASDEIFVFYLESGNLQRKLLIKETWGRTYGRMCPTALSEDGKICSYWVIVGENDGKSLTIPTGR